MTVMAYLFEYTLNVICAGNKSECARKLGMRRPDFNRTEQRFQEGASSIRTTEAVLYLFWKEKRSLDEALKGYLFEHPECGDDAAEAICNDMSRVLREKLADERRASDTISSFLKSAEMFMTQITRIFCTRSCKERRNCETQCPCKQFADLVDWLRAEIEQDMKPSSLPLE